MIRARIAMLVMLSAQPVFAGPFGIEQGMQKEQVKIVKEHKNFRYTIRPPEPDKDFESYLVQLHPSTGICQLRLIGKTISTNNYGEELRDQFNRIKGQISQIYGKSGVNDFLKSGSIWDEPNEWMLSLSQDERVLQAVWDKEAGSTLKDKVDEILLVAKALTTKGLPNGKAYIFLQYNFNNYNACQQAIEIETCQQAIERRAASAF